jgi:RNA polymerase sigma-70 factor, ECF subfamily
LSTPSPALTNDTGGFKAPPDITRHRYGLPCRHGDANEVYLKLIGAGTIECESRTHFLALCAQMSRRIQVDHARRRRSAKRGGDALQVPLDEQLLQAEAGGIEVVTLDRALEALGTIDGRKSRLVEVRYFRGLSVEEAAEVLGVSKETAKRDWKMAHHTTVDAPLSTAIND